MGVSIDLLVYIIRNYNTNPTFSLISVIFFSATMRAFSVHTVRIARTSSSEIFINLS